MRIFYKLICLPLIILLYGCTSGSDPANIPTLIIKNVNTIDAVNGLRANQTILIKEDKIMDIGSVEQMQISSNVLVVDGTDKFLIPGLWDAHVHLTFEPGLESSMFNLFLGYGITSIRDTGGQLELVMPWKEQADQNPQLSPRVMVAGPLLDGIPTVYDGGAPGRPKLGIGAKSTDDAEALVDEFVEGGVDLIKSYEMLTPEAFSAVVKRAQFHGKVVTGHVPLSLDVIEASNIGLRSMEHMRNLEMSCSRDFDSLKSVRIKMLAEGSELPGGDLRSNIHEAQREYSIQSQDEDRRMLVLKALADNGTWQVPTLSIISVSSRRPFTEDAWQKEVQYLPVEVRSKWITGAENFSKQPVKQVSKLFTSWALEMITHLKNANVEIMAGTDTPIAFLIPGFSLHNELVLLVEGGLTPLEALRSATLLPAQYFNMDNVLGTIESGKYADLVLLNANPLDDIRNTQTINSVVKNGFLYDRKALDNLLNGMK